MTPNLYGNLVANTAAGIAGGTGVMPGGIKACTLPYKICVFIIVAFEYIGACARICDR